MVTVDDRTGINEKPTELFYLVLLEINIYIFISGKTEAGTTCVTCVSVDQLCGFTHIRK